MIGLCVLLFIGIGLCLWSLMVRVEKLEEKLRNK